MKRPYIKKELVETPDSPCISCGNTKVLCKKLCPACYSKAKRNTKEGKEKMRLYNITRGREAQRRYAQKLRLNKPPKPPREPKKDCECGKKSIIKGFCYTCYQKYYQRAKNGYLGIKQRTKTSFKYEEVYKQVLLDVKNGITIFESLKKQKVHSSSFYRVISPLQKAELIACRTIGFINEEDD